MIENEQSRLSEATERLAQTSRRVEEEAADVTARLHREERQLVKQKTLLDEDMRRVSLAKEELLRVRDEQENKSMKLNEKEARLFFNVHRGRLCQGTSEGRGGTDRDLASRA